MENRGSQKFFRRYNLEHDQIRFEKEYKFIILVGNRLIRMWLFERHNQNLEDRFALAKRVKPISTMCRIFLLDLPFCSGVCRHKHQLTIPYLVRNGAKILNSSPLSDCRH